MLNLEKAKEQKCYEFSWELIGYDCGPPKIRSPTFKVNFEVTEWYMELDLSKLQNIDSYIPFRLQRMEGIGPYAVHFDVAITVKLGENKLFDRQVFHYAKSFSEQESFVEFNIKIPSQELESKDDLNWLTSKTLLINVEMKSSKKTDPEFPKKYWYTNASLKAVVNNLRSLLSDGCFHDLVLKVAGEEFKLHKCILNARWPKLVSTLKIGKSTNAEFSGIPPVILKHLLEFAYCGNLNFMNDLFEIDGGIEVFNLVKEYNFYRLNDQITQLSPTCSSSQILQSYRTSVEMKFTDVTSTEKAMGDFRTCEIPLKPRQLPRSDEPLSEKEREKFQKHIRFMDLRVYVNKGLLGYNWLVFSVVLGKIPKENPVNIKCKLYVVGETNVKYLLAEQNLVFDINTAVPVTTPFSKGKESKRYHKISEPVITWEELIDERNNFMRKRVVVKSPGELVEEKDICFRFELKLADGEYLHDTRHGECEFMYEGDYKIFQDYKLMCNDETLADIEVTSEKRCVVAHKAILAARSDVLKAILEKRRNCKSLKLDIQDECLRVFIEYLYTGQLQEVSVDKIDHLLDVANAYKMDCLKDVLEEYKCKSNGVVPA